MLLNYLRFYLLIVLKLIIAEHYHAIINNHDNIISISSILGSQLLFNVEILDEVVNNEDIKTIVWYKGLKDLKTLVSNSISLDNSQKLLVNFTRSTQSRFYVVNQTKLIIEQTVIGDEGFYTLKIQTKSNNYKKYFYHVILFTKNLSLFILPLSYEKMTYHAEQQINFTCSISLFADHIYIEQIRSLFFSTWHMIIYNNDPDYYQLISLSSNSYTYIAYLINYEVNQNDHNKTVSCSFIQQEFQQIVLLNNTLSNMLNIEYKAYLRGNYYFTRSFNAHSSIEINCEEFDANPKPVYTLIWILNEENQILLNKTKHGKYFINDATWKHRGNYTCLAENYLNNNQAAHQSFRLNIWFTEHHIKTSHYIKTFALQQLSKSNKTKIIILILLILINIFACLILILSFYYFCLQIK